jgi:hypothetical protein
MTIVGTEFNYPYGPLSDSPGTLTGVLASGESINISFRIEGDASIVLVPEPSPMVLLTMTTIGLLIHTLGRRGPKADSQATGTLHAG